MPPAFSQGGIRCPPSGASRTSEAAHAARLPQSYDRLFDTVRVRTAYRCRAYPDQAQQQMLTRTFGCVRVVAAQRGVRIPMAP
jgi:hypothetical protein